MDQKETVVADRMLALVAEVTNPNERELAISNYHRFLSACQIRQEIAEKAGDPLSPTDSHFAAVADLANEDARRLQAENGDLKTQLEKWRMVECSPGWRSFDQAYPGPEGEATWQKVGRMLMTGQVAQNEDQINAAKAPRKDSHRLLDWQRESLRRILAYAIAGKSDAAAITDETFFGLLKKIETPCEQVFNEDVPESPLTEADPNAGLRTDDAGEIEHATGSAATAAEVYASALKSNLKISPIATEGSSEPVTMTWAEACNCLLQKKKIRRQRWHQGHYITISFGLVKMISDDLTNPWSRDWSLDDMTATDWVCVPA